MHRPPHRVGAGAHVALVGGIGAVVRVGKRRRARLIRRWSGGGAAEKIARFHRG